MIRRILITRSQPGADATARRLTECGYEAIVEPLLAIEPIATTLPAFDALAFTSVNGVRRFISLSAKRDVTAWCVGERTAAEAKHAGFDVVHSAAGAVADLVELIANELPATAEVLHVGNEESRGDLAGELTKRGHSAQFLATYRTRSVTTAGPGLAAYLNGEAVLDCIFLHSPKAAAALARLALAFPQRPVLRVVAISEQTALELSGVGVDISIADRPNEQSMIAAMEAGWGRG